MIGGGQAGYNYEIGQGVFGIETDIDFTDASQNHTLTIGPAGAPFSVTTTGNGRLDWIGTTRGRLGYAFGYENRLLAYATGGVAYGGGHDSGSVTINGTTDLGPGRRPQRWSAGRSAAAWNMR